MPKIPTRRRSTKPRSAERFHARRLIVGIDAAEFQVDVVHEAFAASAGGARVERSHQKTAFRERIGQREGFTRADRVRPGVNAHQKRIFVLRIEVRRDVQHAVEIGLAVGGLELQQFHPAKAQFVVVGQIAFGQFGDFFAVGVHQTRNRRRVVRLRGVDEMLSIRGDIHGMKKRRIGKPFVALAVESDAMQLQFHRIIAVVGHVIELARLFVEADDFADLEFVIRERGEQFAAQFVEIKILPAVAFRGPDKAFPVLEKTNGRRILRPTCRPLLADDDAARAGSPDWRRRTP